MRIMTCANDAAGIRVKASNSASAIFFTRIEPSRGWSFWIAAQIPNAAGMRIARRVHCVPTAARNHIPCTIPDFPHDVPDCSVQSFLRRKNSIFMEDQKRGSRPAFGLSVSG
jgi:hypothetical protein